ncbi:basic proline-rich protein-like [Ammospiza caudacuta]|uniref:basic proline-rich protein-like n=1 Tax=Ammospiza caudacuta TaxID=2857398 RepID=UPI002738EF09|nr:basic proline-rich protein-like [Ammospiza caudacuta]
MARHGAGTRRHAPPRAERATGGTERGRPDPRTGHGRHRARPARPPSGERRTGHGRHRARPARPPNGARAAPSAAGPTPERGTGGTERGRPDPRAESAERGTGGTEHGRPGPRTGGREHHGGAVPPHPALPRARTAPGPRTAAPHPQLSPLLYPTKLLPPQHPSSRGPPPPALYVPQCPPPASPRSAACGPPVSVPPPCPGAPSRWDRVPLPVPLPAGARPAPLEAVLSLGGSGGAERPEPTSPPAAAAVGAR